MYNSLLGSTVLIDDQDGNSYINFILIEISGCTLVVHTVLFCLITTQCQENNQSDTMFYFRYC